MWTTCRWPSTCRWRWRYPFYERFENGLSHWLHAGWGTDTNAPYAGSYAVHDTVPVRIAPDTTLWLTLAGELNLTNALNPQLTFWVRGHCGTIRGCDFRYRRMAGLNWPELGAVNLDTGFNADWTRKQVALTSYTNQTVRVRFQVWSYYGSAPDEDLFLDNIAVAELPSPVVLETTTPHLKSVDLQWTVSTLGAAFKRNEVYRATHPNVTMADTLLGVFTNAAVTSIDRRWTVDWGDLLLQGVYGGHATMPTPRPTSARPRPCRWGSR